MSCVVPQDTKKTKPSADYLTTADNWVRYYQRQWLPEEDSPVAD